MDLYWGLMRQQSVGRHVNGLVVKVADYHGEANCRERTVFLLCLIVTVSLAIDTVLCPVDVALAQVTIIPGTDDDDDNFEDDIEDGGDESEEITFTDAEKGFVLSEPLTLTMKLGEPSTTSISG